MAKLEDANPRCLSGIIRRMLCTGNVPTHPSDSDEIIKDSKAKITKKEEKKTEIQAQSSAPNIVAKLMGLDSLPADTNWAPKGTTQDSFSRSRSVNFADYLLKFDLTDHQSHQHRRTRTSVSFREVPASFQSHKSDFLVVYLDNVDDTSMEMRKSELGFGEVKQGKRKEKSTIRESKREYNNEKTNNKISKLKNEPRKKITVPRASETCKQNGTEVLGSVLPYKNKKEQKNSAVKLKVLKPENQKKAPEKFTRKRTSKQANNKIQPIESNPENQSEVSVHDEVYNFHSEGQSRSTNSDLKTEFQSTVCCGSDELKLGRVLKKDCGRAEKREMADFTELAEQLLRLAEEDLSETYWVSSREKNVLDFEGLEDICREFEWRILDGLLNEVTSEVVEVY